MAVKPGEHKSVLMTDLQLALSLGWKDLQYSEPYCMLDEGRDLSILLRQPFFCVDGMNDAGLCIAAYQLPTFADPKNPVQEAGPNKCRSNLFRGLLAEFLRTQGARNVNDDALFFDNDGRRSAKMPAIW